MDRGYAESLMRGKSAGVVLLEPNYIKSFNWDRMFNIRFDLTRSLRLEFNSSTQARIDEPAGRMHPDDDDYQAKRDSIWDNIRNFGRTTFYTHRANLTYNIPLNLLPLVDFINANASYAADFDWIAAPLSAVDLGNSIENSQSMRLNVNANLVNLYNKVGFLQRINQQRGRPGAQQQRGGQTQRGPQAPRGREEETPEDDRPNYPRIVMETLLRAMMGVRNLSINYTETSGTHMPGFTPTPSVFGQDWNMMAPGTGFILGSQQDIRDQAAREGWITDNPNLNLPFRQNRTKNLTARSQIEPFPDMRIEVTAQRNHSLQYSEYFKADSLGVFDSFNPMERGNFSISFFALLTTFDRIDDRTYSSQNFENFKDHRLDIALRLATRNPNWDGEMNDTTGFPVGYGPTSQDVLIPAFIAAYSGKDPSESTLSPFLRIPMPGWRLTYDGLSRIPAFQRIFRSFTIGHGYRSTFTIGNFQSDIRYREQDGYQIARDNVTQNFIPEYEIGQVSINEQFNPLVNIDVTWQNNLMTRLEYRRSRDINLSFANNQITDHYSSEIIVGAGYRFQNLSFNITQGGRRQRIESDLVLRFDMSIRENRTILRKLLEETDVISAGQQAIGLNTSAEYQISPRVNFRFFFDRTINNPFVSNQFPSTNTHGGFSLRFTLI